MPKNRSTAAERARLERSIIRQMRLVTARRLAGQAASEERFRLGGLHVRLALLAMARPQPLPTGPLCRPSGSRLTAVIPGPITAVPGNARRGRPPAPTPEGDARC
jgi:hypothetical protein